MLSAVIWSILLNTYENNWSKVCREHKSLLYLGQQWIHYSCVWFLSSHRGFGLFVRRPPVTRRCPPLFNTHSASRPHAINLRWAPSIKHEGRGQVEFTELWSHILLVMVVVHQDIDVFGFVLHFLKMYFYQMEIFGIGVGVCIYRDMFLIVIIWFIVLCFLKKNCPHCYFYFLLVSPLLV